MKLLNVLLDLFFPPSCVSCGELVDPKESFCHECKSKWSMWTSYRCPKCGHPAPFCFCPPRNRKSIKDDRIFYAFFYDPKNRDCVANRLIYSLKQENEHRVVAFLAACLAQSIQSSAYAYGLRLSEYAITYPPRSRRAIRINGFDHTALLARFLGKELGLPVLKTLERRGSRVQKNLSAKERRLNAAHSYRLRRGTDLTGKKLILVDDVITTGATLTVCEALLYTAGAEDVLLCALAKDI